jgi:hypothetical protein
MSEPLKSFGQIVREALSWLYRGRNHLVWLGLPTVTIVSIYMLPTILDCKERDVRSIGFLYQLVGFILLAYHFNAEADKNGYESWQKWWMGRPRFRGPTNHVIALASISAGLTVVGSARVTVKAGPNSTLEQRLKILENSNASLEQHLSEVQREGYESISKLRDDFQTSDSRLTNGLREIEGEIKEVSGKAARLNLFGIAFFVWGIVFATLSPEITSLFSKQFSCGQPLFAYP